MASLPILLAAVLRVLGVWIVEAMASTQDNPNLGAAETQ